MSATLYDFSKCQARHALRELDFSRARARHDVDLLQQDLMKLDRGLLKLSRRLDSLLTYYGGLQNAVMQTNARTAHCQNVLELGNLEEMEKAHTHYLKLHRDQPSRGRLRLYLG